MIGSRAFSAEIATEFYTLLTQYILADRECTAYRPKILKYNFELKGISSIGKGAFAYP